MIKLASAFITEAQNTVHCVDTKLAKTIFDTHSNVVLLDVRESESAKKLNINHSINISRGLIEMKVPNQFPDPNTVILVHCAGGGRASMAAARLQEMGYRNVHAITAKFEDIKAEFDQ